MAVNFNTDLLSSLGNTSLFGTSSSNSSDMGFSITDYASIKNGSYGKLLKAYYSKDKSSAKTSAESADNKESSKISLVKSTAEDLKASVSGLSSAIKSGNADKIFEAAKSFAEDYNSLVSAAGSADKASIKRTATNMIDEMGSHLSLLKQAGFSMDIDGKLSVDEETVKKAGTALNTLFNSAGSLGSSIQAKTSSIASSATNLLKKGNLYSANASYSKTNDIGVGSIYDSTL